MSNYMAAPQILKAKKSDCPTLKDITNFIVPDVHHKWYNLGLQLLDSKNETFLYSLRTRYHDSSDQCTEIFIRWLDVTKKPTWSKILKTLKKRSVNLPNVAHKLKQLLDKRGNRPRLSSIDESHPTSAGDTDAEDSDDSSDRPSSPGGLSLPSNFGYTSHGTENFTIKVNDNYLSHEALQKEIYDNNLQIKELNERSNKYEMAIKSLQSDVTQIQNELKQQKSGYNHDEVESYKIQIITEKETTTKVQQDLAQVSTEFQKQEKVLRKAQNDLQLTVEKLRDTEETLKNLEQSHHKLLHEKQNLEDILKQHNAHIKEMEDSNNLLQNEKEDVTNRLIQSLTENKNLTAALQEKESAIQSLQEENNKLKKELDRQFLENREKFENQSQSEKKATTAHTKAQKALLQELTVSLEEKFHEVRSEKQNSEKYQSEIKEHKVENLEKKLRDHQATDVQKQTAAPEIEKTTEPGTTTQVNNPPIIGDRVQFREEGQAEKQPTNNHNTERTSLQNDKEVPLTQPPRNHGPENVKYATFDRRSLGPQNLLRRSHSFGNGQIRKPKELPKPKKAIDSPTSIPGSSSPKSPQPGGMYKPNQVNNKILIEKPKLWKLKMNVIPKIMDHWKVIGLRCLCFNTAVIAEIEKQGKSDPKHCCTILFDNWLTKEMGVTPKTWDKLLIQLGKIEEIADEVEEITKKFK